MAEPGDARILLFIPMYNCAPQIPRVLGQLTPEVARWFAKVIVVNNRSTDDGEAAAVDAATRVDGTEVVVLRNDDNYGLGGSHKVAFEHALAGDFTHVVVLHGDDQGRIADLVPHLEAGEHLEVDALLGARFHPDSTLPGYSAFRTFGNHVFNRLFSVVCGARIHDLGSGLNLYDVRILADRFWRRFPDDLTFNYAMSMAHAHLGHRVRFFPIVWREDDQISNVKLASQARRVMGMLADFARNREAFVAAEHRITPRDAYTAQAVQTDQA